MDLNTGQDLQRLRLDQPPSRRRALSLAGQDVTDAFVAYHPGSAWQHLDQFFTGFQLESYSVSEMGLFENRGHGVHFSLFLVAMLFTLRVYGVLCSDSCWVHLGSGGLMGFLWIQSGWLGHDSGKLCTVPKNLVWEAVHSVG